MVRQLGVSYFLTSSVFLLEDQETDGVGMRGLEQQHEVTKEN